MSKFASSAQDMRANLTKLGYLTQILTGKISWPVNLGSPEDWAARIEAGGDMSDEDIKIMIQMAANSLNRDVVVFR